MILLGRDEIPRTRIHIGQDWQLWVRHGDDSYTTFSAGLAVLLQLQLQLQCSHGGWRMDDVRAARFFFFSGSLGLSHSSTGKSRLLECSLFEVTCCLVHHYIDNIFFPRRSRGSTIVLLKDASIRLVGLVVHGQGAVPLVEQAQGKYRFQMLMEHMSIPEWQCRSIRDD